MSNLYVTEPAPTGKVIVDTTLGEIEIELWAKECPKACRNFLALVMEGYYDGVIFHRVVPGFIAQTGDPTGSGMGGESVYGEPFENEPHSRLKFNRRGLVGMANNGGRSTNTSQWFITLDRADELQQKHTLFGRIMGPTIFNVLKIGDLELDKNERPIYPPKINGVRIVEDPFGDIVPRISAAERKAQQLAREESVRQAEARESRKKAKKNTGLLSFGEDADAGVEVGIKKKTMSRPDLIDPEEKLAPTQSYVPLPASLAGLGKDSGPKTLKRRRTSGNEDEDDVSKIRANHEAAQNSSAAARQAEIEKMQAKLRRLDKRRGSESDESDDDHNLKSKKRSGPSFLDQELAKYTSFRKGARKGNKRSEEDTLAALSNFSGKIRKADRDERDEDEGGDLEGKGPEQGNFDDEGEEGMEVDDDVAWMGHALKAVKDDGEQTRRAETDYTVIDPRAKAKELSAAAKGKSIPHHKGRRGRDWV